MAEPDSLPLETLIDYCEECWKTYNPAATTPDTHIEERLLEWNIESKKDCDFIQQSFYGMTRYKKLLHVLVQAFYYVNSSVASRSDVHKYMLFTYLTLIRLKDLTFHPYRKLVVSQDGQKMLVLLQFIFSEKNLVDWCKDEWLKLYDVEFIESLISDVLKWLPMLDEMIRTLEEKVYLSKKKEEEQAVVWSGNGQANVTIPQPFKLREPQPKLVQPEYQPPPAIKAKPAPARKPPGTLNKQQEAMKQISETNRKFQLAKYSDPEKGPFKLKTTDRPSNLDKVRQEVEARIQDECPFKMEEPAKPAPAPPVANVKLNAAAILREDALYKKKQEQEAEAIKRYERDLRDDSEFQRWKVKMTAKDEQDRLDHIEQRKLEMEAEAALARQQRENRETEKVAAMKREAEEIQRQLELERQAELASNRERREIIVEARMGARIASEKLEDEKRTRATEMAKEKEDNARRRAEERALEMVRKQDLIRQLKAIEAVPISEIEKYDPTTTAGQGLLEEMSLAELREQLAVVKRRQEQERLDKRHDIVTAKQKREELLLAKAANITRIRDMANSQAADRRVKTNAARAEAVLKERREREDKMLVLHDRLEDKHERYKEEQLRLAAEEKAIRFEQTKQAASKGAVEETKFVELRKGQERALKKTQVATQVNSAKEEAAKQRTRNIRSGNLKVEQKGRRDFCKEFDEQLKQLGEEKDEMLAQDLARKQEMVADEQNRYATMRDKGLFTSARQLPGTGIFQGSSTGRRSPGKMSPERQ